MSGHVGDKLQIVLADRAFVNLGQEQAAESFPKFLCPAKFMFRVRCRSASVDEQDAAFLVIDDTETTSPSHQVIIAIQEIRPPSFTATVDRIDEVKRRVTAWKADVIDRLLRAHDLKNAPRNDLGKAEL